MAVDKPKIGRPLKYDNVEEMQQIIDEYFEECANHEITITPSVGKPYKKPSPIIPTVSELAYKLDMSRKMLIEYNGRAEFRNAITRARRYIESQTERLLFVSGISHGVQFNLKNNFEAWEDRSKVDENVSGSLTVKNVDYKNADPSIPEEAQASIQPL